MSFQFVQYFDFIDDLDTRMWIDLSNEWWVQNRDSHGHRIDRLLIYGVAGRRAYVGAVVNFLVELQKTY